METILHNGDHILAWNTTSLIQTILGRHFLVPERQEVIAFHAPFDANSILVKRIIGIGGDRVRIDDGHVILNGVSLVEPYVVARKQFKGNASSWPLQWDPTVPREIVVPIDRLFVLGDNREVSYDSRYWGSVPTGDVIGTVLLASHGWHLIAVGK